MAVMSLTEEEYKLYRGIMLQRFGEVRQEVIKIVKSKSSADVRESYRVFLKELDVIVDLSYKYMALERLNRIKEALETFKEFELEFELKTLYIPAIMKNYLTPKEIQEIVKNPTAMKELRADG